MENKFQFRRCNNNNYYNDGSLFFYDEAYCTQPGVIGATQGLVVACLVMAVIMAALTFKSVMVTLSKIGRGCLSALETNEEFTMAGQQTLVEDSASTPSV